MGFLSPFKPVILFFTGIHSVMNCTDLNNKTNTTYCMFMYHIIYISTLIIVLGFSVHLLNIILIIKCEIPFSIIILI